MKTNGVQADRQNYRQNYRQTDRVSCRGASFLITFDIFFERYTLPKKGVKRIYQLRRQRMSLTRWEISGVKAFSTF